ncbi:UDP-glucuronosyltransferase 2B1-like [Ischnura elegans]|uniref:UDP-glucuronosyltransferase 2B1-like n=1 Tax=Ischnura elegans TaxID=197161 RepID=UPI001ED88B28|nr:UDP-glucuronosyltransferase 2B1-like [Ischnura elegans]
MFEPEFRDNVLHRSLILRDQPETPLDRAVYWTEYIIRHGGARHLQSPVRNFSIMQAYGVDVMAFFLLISMVFLAAISAAVWFTLPILIAKLRISKRVPTTAVPSVRQLAKRKVH